MLFVIIKTACFVLVVITRCAANAHFAAKDFVFLNVSINFAAYMQNVDKHIYSQQVLDFVRVSTEYCKFLEQCAGMETTEFCRVMRGVLPMLYLKVTLIGQVPEAAGWNGKHVTEEDYNYIRSAVASGLGRHDDFLDVFVEDFKYSEQPVLCTISENLADVYQQLRELVEAYREGFEYAMEVALYETLDEFKIQWGQKLLNALRALHDISVSGVTE